MIGYFPEGERVRASLASSRAEGLPFAEAWNLAMRRARLHGNDIPLSGRRAEVADALRFAQPAFRRAYKGQPRTRQDVAVGNLVVAMEAMYDYSEDAAATRGELVDLMRAA